MKIKKEIISVFIVLCMAFFVATNVFAQNFAGTVPHETTQDQPNTGNSPFIAEPIAGDQTKIKVQEEAITQLTSMPEVIQDLSTYSLGKTDIIEISVLRHPEVSGQYVINNEGKIQYEFVGDVKIEGMTKDEVRDNLTELLATYIIAPEVTVKIVGYNSKVVYVIGEVARPGKIYMRGDTITVREALMQAGLPLLTAATGKSRLITPAETGKPENKRVNVHKLLYEGDLRENLVMQPGDTLYIPATVLAKTMRILNPIAQPIGTAAGTGRTVTTGF